jgi:hypothetical protein
MENPSYASRAKSKLKDHMIPTKTAENVLSPKHNFGIQALCG